MEFRLLGPLEIRHEGRSLEVRGTKRRALLALLLLHANEVVRADRLVEELWGERQPANAAGALHNHVSRLRRDLGADLIATRPWGYVLRADPETIDVNRFERLVRDAEPLPAGARAERLAEALALWRGGALEDIASEPAVRPEAERLDELRLRTLEQRISADLELGRNAEVVPELEGLVAQHPLRERLRGLLILALYRSGRQAEALETYRETRRILVDELGIEPSPELRDLERAILRQDPDLTPASPPAPLVSAPTELVRRPRWRSRLPIALLAFLVVAGAATAGVLAQRDAGEPERAAARPPAAPSPPPAPPPTTTVIAEPPAAPPPAPPKPPPPAPPASGPAPQPPPAAAPPPPPASTTRGGSTTRPPAPPPAQPRPPAAVPPPAPAPAVYTFADDFDDPLFDFNLWHEVSSGGEGADLDERGGRLEASISADSRSSGPDDHVERHYGTNCRATGDFDVRVAFELLTWPAANGVRASLAAYLHDRDELVSVARESSAQAERYAASIVRRSRAATTTDDAGWLRLRRHDGRITAYRGRPRRWVALAAADAPGPVTFVVAVTAPGALFAHTDVRVAYDNFTATAAGVGCPSGTPRPPRTS